MELVPLATLWRRAMCHVLVLCLGNPIAKRKLPTRVVETTLHVVIWLHVNLAPTTYPPLALSIMASIFPPFPRFVFTIFEPLSLVAGVFAAVLDTENFVKGQLPSASATPVWPAASTRVLTLQLGNLYGLLGMIGIGVLYFTSEVRVVRNYILACAIADVGHLWATYAVMGQKDFLDAMNWNAVAWGNIGITVALLITRVLYLAGMLGEDKVVESTKQAMKKRS